MTGIHPSKTPSGPRIVWKRNKSFLLENFLSPSECEHFVDLSEAKGYKQIPGKRSLRSNCKLILFDQELAGQFWKRIRPFVPSTLYVAEKKETWNAKELNSRFRFCRYTEGQFFTKHYDEQVEHNGMKSFYTMMIYLNEVKNEQGGETRFFTNDVEEKLDFVVQPTQGCAILLWQQGTLHDGAPLLHGRKYILRTEVMYRRNTRKG